MRLAELRGREGSKSGLIGIDQHLAFGLQQCRWYWRESAEVFLRQVRREQPEAWQSADMVSFKPDIDLFVEAEEGRLPVSVLQELLAVISLTPQIRWQLRVDDFEALREVLDIPCFWLAINSFRRRLVESVVDLGADAEILLSQSSSTYGHVTLKSPLAGLEALPAEDCFGK